MRGRFYGFDTLLLLALRYHFLLNSAGNMIRLSRCLHLASVPCLWVSRALIFSLLVKPHDPNDVRP